MTQILNQVLVAGLIQPQTNHEIHFLELSGTWIPPDKSGIAEIV